MGSNEDRNHNLYDHKTFDLTDNIMLAAIAILFVVIVLIFLHLYARWYLRRARRRLRLRRRAHLVIYVDPVSSEVPSRGLDPSVVQSLPVFVYSSDTHSHSDPVECAVCLSEFDENESGRVLPKCNHTFHAECIDIWFQSHSTCPLCRSMVEPAPTVDRTGPEVVIDICEPAGPEPGSAIGLTAECGDGENRTGTTLSSSLSSIGLRRKPSSLAGVAVEVSASRSLGKEVEASACGSPSSFRSPKSRMLSFKRILSRERKASLSPSSGSAVEGGSTIAITELDRERVG